MNTIYVRKPDPEQDIWVSWPQVAPGMPVVPVEGSLNAKFHLEASKAVQGAEALAKVFPDAELDIEL